MKIPRDFFSRTPEDQAFISSNTWCAACREPDVGIASPCEYGQDGAVFVEGACNRCGALVKTEIVEKTVG